jgi:glycosyltransferase involved in cell wall biosynthesis
MTIGIDGNEANVPDLVGVSVYCLRLLERFRNNASAETQFRVFLRHPPRDTMPNETEYFRYEVVPGSFLWSQLWLPLRLRAVPIDVFFAPAHYSPRFYNGPLVVTVHDVSYFYYPSEFLKKDLFKLRNWTKYSVDRARKVIAVSKTTKKDIIHWYGLDDAMVEMVYNGFEKPDAKPTGSDALSRLGLKKNGYLLYVGTIQPRKNIATAVKALKRLNDAGNSLKLVVTGRKGWLYKDLYALVDELSLHDDVLFTGYLPDEDVAALYKSALCFVMPSFYEGFGIPILEAMSYGCPVIASIQSSLPEIGGDACLYFDPDREQELSEKIIQLRDNAELRKELIGLGKKRVAGFSWDSCAERTLAVLTAAAGA